MKNLLFFILLSASFAHASVIPVDNPSRVVEDELFPYQWGLLNQGQTLIREKDDIHNLPMKGTPGKDIGWKKLSGLERRPIVAVLDSGVDLSHPELQGNLWTNEGECGKDPAQDNDGNQLAGDCNGWNFTELIDSDAAKNPSDVDGHGTHIAGIIAALNNGSGMVGVTPNALIMPVKVMRDSNSESTVPSSEAFARGIIYAVDNGADVINMSLGWPRSLETKALRDAVYYALGNGVPIVAAAGNNNSSEPLYPCAYDGVICVGATTINGGFASFSNFGGHVDTVAPGEGILGLHPVLLEPDYFPVPGFELRSGTSQSAPMVAGMIAALKAMDKTMTIDEIFARLYQADSVLNKNKYILGGEATWELLNTQVTTPVIRPVFKNLRQILFRGNSSESKIPLRIRNFGLPSSEIIVKVESLSGALKVSESSETLSSLNKGQFKDLLFDVSLVDQSGESNVSLKVTIEHNGKSTSYVNEVPVVRDLRQDPEFKKSNFVFANGPLPVGAVKEGQILPIISTLDSYGNSPAHEFFMKRTLKEEKQVEIIIFRKNNDQYIQKKNTILIDNALLMVNLIRVDLNFDGTEDYIVQTLAEADEKKFFQYSFYNEELLALWPDFQHVKLNLDLYVERLNDMAFMKYEDPKRGTILVPAYFTNGMIPKIDQTITSWDRADASRKKRIYFLEPNGTELRIRTLTTKTWEENVKKELKSKWFETVETEQVLPVSKEDKERGQLRALVSVGLGTRRQLFIHTFDTKLNTHGSKLPQLVLQSDSVDPLLEISPRGLEVSGDVYFNIYDRTRARLVTTKGQSQLGQYVLKHETESDLIAGHISSYKNGTDQFSVFQTREELISITQGSSSIRSSRPKLRYSFLSQKLLSEMYFPVSYNREGNHRPALYVDATSVTGNRIYLFEDQNGQLVSSIRNSILVSPNCKPLNPKFNTDSGSHEFVFLCIEKNEFVIRSYEMN
ncbi:MAG: S8 family peptidase [Bacteriovoracia bacterium]